MEHCRWEEEVGRLKTFLSQDPQGFMKEDAGGGVKVVKRKTGGVLAVETDRVALGRCYWGLGCLKALSKRDKGKQSYNNTN